MWKLSLAHHVGAKKIGCRCHIMHANKRILAHASSQLDETPILMLLPVLGSYQIQKNRPRQFLGFKSEVPENKEAVLVYNHGSQKFERIYRPP
jgi:hypothetical protein